jgi:amino acid permease
MTVLSSWTGISLTMSAAFLNGGPTTLVWGTLLSGLGSLAIAASLGELASMYVRAGGFGTEKEALIAGSVHRLLVLSTDGRDCMRLVQ